MHQIVQTTHAIFSVDGAGLMLADVDHHLLNAAVSDDRMRHLEELQIRHQEGPCIAAFEDKELVCAEDLTTEERWPLFSEQAVARGVRAVLASPIPYNQDAVGVVAVMSEQRRPWSAEAELALFFFQAEDGIRDLYVTGVQTCALPISEPSAGNFGLFADFFFLYFPIHAKWRIG